MNRQIARLALVGLGLMAALIVATTYWQTWATAGLADRQDNEIQRVAQFSIKRGLIRAADGTILATNRKRRVAGQTLYFRRYPQHGLFAHIVGYSTQSRSRSGLEASENDYLTGSNANLHTVLDTTLNRIRGATIKGNDLWLTLRPGAQRWRWSSYAWKLWLRGRARHAHRRGTRRRLASDLRPQPGREQFRSDKQHSCLLLASGSAAQPRDRRAVRPGIDLQGRDRAARARPGQYTSTRASIDRGYCIEYGKQVRNAGDHEAPETFGSVDFLQALEHSINSVFCNIGKTIGAGRILGTPSGTASTPTRRSRRLATSARPAASTTTGRGCF